MVSSAPIDLALLLLRVVFGVFLAVHGINKVRGGIAGTVRWFAGIGFRWPRRQAQVAALTETGAGLLFAVGLLTPLAAAAIIAVMVVATVVAHLRVGFFVYLPGQGWEYTVSIAVVAVAVGTAGAGQWSLDDAIGVEPTTWGGTWGQGLVAVVVGLVAAALQLAVCYRPATLAAGGDVGAAAEALGTEDASA